MNPNFLSNHEGGVFHSIFFPSIPFLVKQYAIATRGQACVSHRNNSYRSLPRDKRIEGRFMRLAGRDGGCSRGWSRERARILARLCWYTGRDKMEDGWKKNQNRFVVREKDLFREFGLAEIRSMNGYKMWNVTNF